MDMPPLLPRSKRNEKWYFLRACLIREYQRPSADGSGAETTKGMQTGLFGNRRCSLSSFSILGTGCMSRACGSPRSQAAEVWHPALLAASLLVTFGKVMLCASIFPLQNSCVSIVVELFLFISANFMDVYN